MSEKHKSSFLPGDGEKDEFGEMFNRSRPESYCAARKKNLAVREMNKVYGLLMEAYGNDAKGKESLKKAQKAWEKYLDLEIASEISLFYGGYPESTAYSFSFAELTNERINRMRKILNHIYIVNQPNTKKKAGIKAMIHEIDEIEARDKKEIDAIEKELNIKAERINFLELKP